jgi:hypothetical protein
MDEAPTRKLIDRDELTRKLNAFADECCKQGRLIEAGWIGMRLACVPADAPQVQLDEMRMAFFAGAQHLFGSLSNIIDPEQDVTDADMVRMEKIDLELRQFIKVFEKKHGLTS